MFKFILVNLIFLFSIFSEDINVLVDRVPNPRATDGSWVYDGVGILKERKEQINTLISEHEGATTNEIALVILFSIDENNPKEFATELFNKWKIGKKGKDNGILVLHIIDQRRVEIETGYGVEGILTDAKCGWIIDDITIPYFKAKNFPDGHYETIRAIIRGLSDETITQEKLTGDTITKPEDRQVEAPLTDSEKKELEEIQKTKDFFYKYLPLGLLSFSGVVTILWIILYFIIPFIFRFKPYSKYKLYNNSSFLLEFPSLLSVGAIIPSYEYGRFETYISPFILFFVAILFQTVIREKISNYFRNLPHYCPKCNRTMRKLGEKEDDKYLEKGNVAEEELHSMDYDVWECKSCDLHKIEAYKGTTDASKCSSCGYLTYILEKTDTLQAATYSSSGTAIDYYKCHNCNTQKSIRRTIPKLESSSSSSSSGGGSSSSSSFGGGSSGGGGAGGSY